VFLQQEGRRVRLAEGHGAGDADREGGDLDEAGMGLDCLGLSPWTGFGCAARHGRCSPPWPALPEAPSRLTTPQALYRGGCWSGLALEGLKQKSKGMESWPGADATEPCMFVACLTRQRHPVRRASATLVGVLWLDFLWASTLPGGRKRALLLEWGALS